MREIVERAWRTAAECAARADETTDIEVKEFFIKRRNAWIEAANRFELLGFTEEQCISIRDPQPGPHPAHHRLPPVLRLNAIHADAVPTRVERLML